MRSSNRVQPSRLGLNRPQPASTIFFWSKGQSVVLQGQICAIVEFASKGKFKNKILLEENMKFILNASIAFALQCNVQQVDDFVIIKFVSTVLVIKSSRLNLCMILIRLKKLWLIGY